MWTSLQQLVLGKGHDAHFQTETTVRQQSALVWRPPTGQLRLRGGQIPAHNLGDLASPWVWDWWTNWLAVHSPSSFSASLWQNCQGPSPGLQFVTTSVNSVMVGEVSCSCSVPESSLESWAWLSQSMAHVPSQMLQYFFAVMKQQMYRQKHP